MEIIMHLQLTTHNLEISFTCDDEDYYDHTNLLKKLAEIIDELDNHTNVDLVITSAKQDDDADDVDQWKD
ncbi:MAG: hypothetical protein EBR82_58970 [Caulobacteraceae bacterium]|nr:hypothetical protein [Caulobacteraceae bacterium]